MPLLMGSKQMRDKTKAKTSAHSFWGNARPYQQIWRTLLGLVIIHTAFFAATFGIFMLGAWALNTEPANILRGATPVETAVFFLTFLGYHLGLWAVVRILHKRGFRTLFGPSLRINWKHFRCGLLIALAISLVAILVQILGTAFSAWDPQAATQAMPLTSWLALILPALALIWMQIMAEELVFRGYLLQQLRARFRSIWLWAILPSLIFGVLHFDASTYGVNAYFYVLHTATVGIVLAIVTLRTGNIGAAAGLHFGNNAMMIASGTKGTLDGFSLFLTEIPLKGALMTSSILTQTTLAIAAFGLWWWICGHKLPIANTAQAD